MHRTITNPFLRSSSSCNLSTPSSNNGNNGTTAMPIQNTNPFASDLTSINNNNNYHHHNYNGNDSNNALPTDRPKMATRRQSMSVITGSRFLGRTPNSNNSNNSNTNQDWQRDPSDLPLGRERVLGHRHSYSCQEKSEMVALNDNNTNPFLTTFDQQGQRQQLIEPSNPFSVNNHASSSTTVPNAAISRQQPDFICDTSPTSPSQLTSLRSVSTASSPSPSQPSLTTSSTLPTIFMSVVNESNNTDATATTTTSTKSRRCHSGDPEWKNRRQSRLYASQMHRWQALEPIQGSTILSNEKETEPHYDTAIHINQRPYGCEDDEDQQQQQQQPPLLAAQDLQEKKSLEMVVVADDCTNVVDNGFPIIVVNDVDEEKGGDSVLFQQRIFQHQEYHCDFENQSEQHSHQQLDEVTSKTTKKGHRRRRSSYTALIHQTSVRSKKLLAQLYHSTTGTGPKHQQQQQQQHQNDQYDEPTDFGNRHPRRHSVSTSTGLHSSNCELDQFAKVYQQENEEYGVYSYSHGGGESQQWQDFGTRHQNYSSNDFDNQQQQQQQQEQQQHSQTTNDMKSDSTQRKRHSIALFQQQHKDGIHPFDIVSTTPLPSSSPVFKGHKKSASTLEAIQPPESPLRIEFVEIDSNSATTNPFLMPPLKQLSQNSQYQQQASRRQSLQPQHYRPGDVSPYRNPLQPSESDDNGDDDNDDDDGDNDSYLILKSHRIGYDEEKVEHEAEGGKAQVQVEYQSRRQSISLVHGSYHNDNNNNNNNFLVTKSQSEYPWKQDQDSQPHSGPVLEYHLDPLVPAPLPEISLSPAEPTSTSLPPSPSTTASPSIHRHRGRRESISNVIQKPLQRSTTMLKKLSRRISHASGTAKHAASAAAAFTAGTSAGVAVAGGGTGASINATTGEGATFEPEMFSTISKRSKTLPAIAAKDSSLNFETFESLDSAMMTTTTDQEKKSSPLLYHHQHAYNWSSSTVSIPAGFPPQDIREPPRRRSSLKKKKGTSHRRRPSFLASIQTTWNGFGYGSSHHNVLSPTTKSLNSQHSSSTCTPSPLTPNFDHRHRRSLHHLQQLRSPGGHLSTTGTNTATTTTTTTTIDGSDHDRSTSGDWSRRKSLMYNSLYRTGRSIGKNIGWIRGNSGGTGSYDQEEPVPAQQQQGEISLEDEEFGSLEQTLDNPYSGSSITSTATLSLSLSSLANRFQQTKRNVLSSASSLTSSLSATLSSTASSSASLGGERATGTGTGHRHQQSQSQSQSRSGETVMVENKDKDDYFGKIRHLSPHHHSSATTAARGRVKLVTDFEPLHNSHSIRGSTFSRGNEEEEEDDHVDDDDDDDDDEDDVNRGHDDYAPTTVATPSDEILHPHLLTSQNSASSLVSSISTCSSTSSWRTYTGDHALIGTHPTLLRHFTDHGDSQLLFSDIVIKINRFNWERERILVVTDRNIYILTPHHLSLGRRISLTFVQGLVMSELPDNMCCLRIAHGVDIFVNTRNKHELASCLKRAGERYHDDADADGGVAKVDTDVAVVEDQGEEEEVEEDEEEEGEEEEVEEGDDTTHEQTQGDVKNGYAYYEQSHGDFKDLEDLTEQQQHQRGRLDHYTLQDDESYVGQQQGLVVVPPSPHCSRLGRGFFPEEEIEQEQEQGDVDDYAEDREEERRRTNHPQDHNMHQYQPQQPHRQQQQQRQPLSTLPPLRKGAALLMSARSSGQQSRNIENTDQQPPLPQQQQQGGLMSAKKINPFWTRSLLLGSSSKSSMVESGGDYSTENNNTNNNNNQSTSPQEPVPLPRSTSRNAIVTLLVNKASSTIKNRKGSSMTTSMSFQSQESSSPLPPLPVLAHEQQQQQQQQQPQQLKKKKKKSAAVVTSTSSKRSIETEYKNRFEYEYAKGLFREVCFTLMPDGVHTEIMNK